MPTSAYTICSLTGAVDVYNNSLSCYNVIEIVQFTRIPEPQPGQPQVVARVPTCRIVAVWLRDDADDPNQLYEARLVSRRAGGEVSELGRFPQFRFPTQFHRLVVPEIPIVPARPGVAFVECQIRRAEEGAEWINGNRFPIVFEEVPFQEPRPTDLQAPLPTT